MVAANTNNHSPSANGRRRSSLEESNKTKLGVLEWMGWKRDNTTNTSPTSDDDPQQKRISTKREDELLEDNGPTPVNRESVHTNIRQSWLEILPTDGTDGADDVHDDENIEVQINQNKSKSATTAAPSAGSGSGRRLVPFGDNIWYVDGSVVDFYGFPYPTRMVVIRLTVETGNEGWIWSPIELSDSDGGDDLLKEIEYTVGGPIRHLVSPNAIHWLFLKQWQLKRPEAKVYASPGLAQRKEVIEQGIKFDSTLVDRSSTENPLPSFASEIDQIVFEGGVLDEVVFFHRRSKTAIFCDLIQRHVEEDFKRNSNNNRFKLWLMKDVEGVVGPMGSTPKEWIFAFWCMGKLSAASQQLQIVLEEWQPTRLLIAHGENATTDATLIIAQCLKWIPQGDAINKEKVSCCGISCFPAKKVAPAAVVASAATVDSSTENNEEDNK